jgi:hypothetical protein
LGTTVYLYLGEVTVRNPKGYENWLISLALFLLALIPRWLDLGRFLTADEFLWVDRSRNFLAGLTNSAYRCPTIVETWGFAEGLACTLRTGHPGVTTMWTGSFGLVLRWLVDGRPAALHDYVVAVATNPLDATFVAPERLATVLITSTWIVAVYWLLRRLISWQVALIVALLLALDPFHIALSRVIHHDALSTTFMTLSVLMMLIYWGQGAGRSWLLLSGVSAGFAFLSKSPALYLIPFVALVGLWFTVMAVKRKNDGDQGVRLAPTPDSPGLGPYLRPLARTILDGLLWLAASVAVVVVFWPAMWVAPREAIETVFFIGSKYATGGHAKGNYFLGNVSRDPGFLFYPVTWLYRTSPLVMLGLVSALVMWFGRRIGQGGAPAQSGRAVERPSSAQNLIRYIPLILIFIAGYYLLMTIGEKKQDRYFLPAYPWFSFIAAVGLVWLVNVRAASRAGSPLSRLVLLIIAILIVNGFLVAIHYPYYFTYYNPILGGPRGASKVLTVGWGEGMDLAADYLNQTADPEQTRVSSWYQSTFAPYYNGLAISYSKEKGKVLAGDYVTFYINQIQRQFPDEVLFDYFENRFEPEKTVTLHGVDYAWVYPGLGVDHYLEDQTYTGLASLLAWQWLNGDISLIPGRSAEFELYWEYLGKQPDERFFFRVVDQQDRIWVEGQSRPVIVENPAYEQWREGEIIVERGTLIPPADIPPGLYRLQIGFYTKAPAVTTGELLFDLSPEEALVVVERAPAKSFQLPAAAQALMQPLGVSLTLLGADWPEEAVIPGDTIDLDLYWRLDQRLSAASELHLGLMDESGEAKQAWFNLTLGETFKPEETTWQPGDIIHTRWRLDLLAEVPPGDYYLEVVWPEDTTTVVPFGQLRVAAK